MKKVYEKKPISELKKDFKKVVNEINLDYEKLIRNANSALQNGKSDWSKNYWGTVVAQLERKSKKPLLN
jgi:hypothetical protein